MPVHTHETAFEAQIEAGLVALGYRKRTPNDYNSALCMDTGLIIAFIQATQHQTWARYKKQYPTGAEACLTQRLGEAITQQGVLPLLHDECKGSGCHFSLAYFQSNTTLKADE